MFNRVRLGAVWAFSYALAILVSWIIVAPAHAATTIGPQAWSRYSGTRIVAGPFETPEDCARGAANGNTCRVSVRITVTADPPACPSQPAAETRTQACPTGTTGSWQQSRAYISAPYPTCWTAGPWTPSDTPVGACTAPPPPAGQWLKCADQSGTCQLTGTNRVRFGRDTRWIEKTLTGNVVCNSTVFEGNPTPNEQKTCEVWSTGPAAPPDPDPVPVARTIRWQPPTTNTDGSPLTDLAGFRVNCTSPRGIGLRWTVPSPATLSERIDTAVGSICMVTALNSAGTESPPSASVTIR
jgi:hypothetical protein